MLKSFFLLLATISPLVVSTANAADDPCVYSCSVKNTSSAKAGLVLVQPNQFQPIGGYTWAMNTHCSATLKRDSGDVTFDVQDFFGQQTLLSISANGVYSTATSPGNKGMFELSYGPLQLELTCSHK